MLYLLKAGNGTSEEGCIKQAGLFLCRHVSSRHPGDSGSFLSFGGAEEYGNGLGAGPGAGNGAGAGPGECRPWQHWGIEAGLEARGWAGTAKREESRVGKQWSISALTWTSWCMVVLWVALLVFI